MSEAPSTARQALREHARARIRCPLCGFLPWPGLIWLCGGDGCGYVWDTFATRGVCPRCHCQWTQTQCPACHRWSSHEAWYGSA